MLNFLKSQNSFFDVLYVELKFLEQPTQKKQDKKLHARSYDELIEYMMDNKKIKANITGEALSGKTNLCRKIAFDLKDQSYIPILIEKNNENTEKISSIKKLVTKIFEMQYGEHCSL